MSVQFGTLSDTEIHDFCSRGVLITENFDPKYIQQACYELRASTLFYDLDAETKRNVVGQEGYILIKPKQTILISTLEVLDMPNDILGRLSTKSKLFALGLLPINSYADPGFYGNITIVFNNFSNRYLKILPGQPIAKIEFIRLATPISKPYRGQDGQQSGVWPIAEELIVPYTEAKKNKRVKSIPEEITLSHGNDMGKVIDRVFRFERYLLLAALSYFLLSLIIIAVVQGTSWISTVTAVLLGVVSNLITSVLIFVATSLRR